MIHKKVNVPRTAILKPLTFGVIIPTHPRSNSLTIPSRNCAQSREDPAKYLATFALFRASLSRKPRRHFRLLLVPEPMSTFSKSGPLERGKT